MALSDQEIKVLLKKAKSYEDSATEAFGKSSGDIIPLPMVKTKKRFF